MKQAFEDSVDDYLEFCASRGEEPEKPFSGKFLVRVTPEMHRQIMAEARRHGKSLNAYVVEKLQAGPTLPVTGGTAASTRYGAGRGGWLSITTRRIRLIRVW